MIRIKEKRINFLKQNSGEILTLVAAAVMVVIGITSFVSSTFLSKQNKKLSYQSKAMECICQNGFDTCDGSPCGDSGPPPEQEPLPEQEPPPEQESPPEQSGGSCSYVNGYYQGSGCVGGQWGEPCGDGGGSGSGGGSSGGGGGGVCSCVNGYYQGEGCVGGQWGESCGDGGSSGGGSGGGSSGGGTGGSICSCVNGYYQGDGCVSGQWNESCGTSSESTQDDFCRLYPDDSSCAYKQVNTPLNPPAAAVRFCSNNFTPGTGDYADCVNGYEPAPNENKTPVTFGENYYNASAATQQKCNSFYNPGTAAWNSCLDKDIGYKQPKTAQSEPPGICNVDPSDPDCLNYYKDKNEQTKSGGCFIAGTKILMADGSYKEIQDVKQGDTVNSYNLETKKIVQKKVIQQIIHADNPGGYLVINNLLKVTGNHPLWVNNVAWKRADEVKISDSLMSEEGNLIIVKTIDFVAGNYMVYNLSIEGPAHNYFAEKILAHNKLPLIPWFNPDDSSGLFAPAPTSVPASALKFCSNNFSPGTKDYNDCIGSYKSNQNEPKIALNPNYDKASPATQQKCNTMFTAGSDAWNSCINSNTGYTQTTTTGSTLLTYPQLDTNLSICLNANKGNQSAMNGCHAQYDAEKKYCDTNPKADGCGKAT